MSALEGSWSSFSPEHAAEYLTTRGHPSPESREIVAAILSKMADEKVLSVLDLGCGNGGMGSFLQEHGVAVSYTGVDFSLPLLEAARAAHPDLTFVHDHVEELSTVQGPYDVVLYSHVLEMLGSPQASLQRAAELAPCVIVRFFQPPDAEVDLVELCEMDVGGGAVPYLRRTMSRDYYRLLLARAGCASIDIYRCESARDQVHVLHFAR
jgi:trans-aconitate methyltransferase